MNSATFTQTHALHEAKASSVLTRLDASAPDANAEDALTAFCHQPRTKYLVELDRKAEVIAFLDAHYQGWRERAVSQAQRFVDMTLEQAKASRAMQEIAALGKAWWATDDPRYGQAFERLYLPTQTGELFNWGPFAGQQAAFEWYAHLLLQDCPGHTLQGRAAFLDHAFALVERAWDHYVSNWSQLMLGPEGHNWYIHGIDAVSRAGWLYPELKRAEFYKDAGWSVIEEHMRGNYHRDGGSRETTLGYQGGTLHGLWELYHLAKQHGQKISPAFESRLLRSTHMLIRLMTPQGGLPCYGDMWSRPGHVTHLAATAAALTGDGLCKWAAQHARRFLEKDHDVTGQALPEGVIWRVGLAGAQRYADAKPQPPRGLSICMPDTRIIAMRDSYESDASYLSLTASTRGPVVTSHGHNDIFALDVHALGKRFIGQIGNAPYGQSLARHYDIATRAHSCFTIKGEEQLPIATEWRWQGCVLPRVRRWDVSDNLEIFHGVHEGFYREDRQALHERKIVFIKADAHAKSAGIPGYWVVFDRLEAKAPLDCEIWFHGCVPGAAKDNTLTLRADDGKQLIIAPPRGDELSLRLDESDDRLAYCKAIKTDPANCPAYVYEATATTHCYVWVLMPLEAGEQQPRIERLPVKLNDADASAFDATALRIAHRGHVDTLCMNHKSFDALLAIDHQPSQWGQVVFMRQDAAGQHQRTTVRSVVDGCDEALP